MEKRLKEALDKRTKLNTAIQRLKGRLDAAQNDKERIEGEIRERNIEPHNLDSTIHLLEEKYSELLSDFEKQLNTAQQHLTTYKEK